MMNAPAPWRDRLAFVMLALLLLAAASIVVSCGTSRPPPLPVIEPPKEKPAPAIATPAVEGESDLEGQLRQARDALSTLAMDTASWQARYNALMETKKADDRAAVLGYLRTCCLWVSGLALLGLFVCAALAVFSPIGKPTLAKAAATCGAMLVLAVGCIWCLPWLPFVGVVALVSLAAVALVVGGFLFVRWLPRAMHASVGMAQGFDRMAEVARRYEPETVERLDSVSRETQVRAKALTVGNHFLEAARRHAVPSQEMLTPPAKDFDHG